MSVTACGVVVRSLDELEQDINNLDKDLHEATKIVKEVVGNDIVKRLSVCPSVRVNAAAMMLLLPSLALALLEICFMHGIHSNSMETSRGWSYRYVVRFGVTSHRWKAPTQHQCVVVPVLMDQNWM